MWSRVISIAVSLCLVLAPLSITLDQNSIAQPVTIKIESAEAAIFVPLLAGAVVLGGIGSYFSNTVQGWVDTFAAFIGSLFIYFAAAVLGIAGSAFDFAIGAFASNLTGTLEFWGILEAIRRIWVVFRDLSQIVLIGFFIFIAINIILNNHEYSIKQHAVRAILVALFMNFSLFFSMAVIDVSNFVAYQFYRGIAGVGGASTISNPLGTQANVSGRIITSFGITQLNSWGGMIDELKKNNAGSGTKIVVSSIGIATMFLIAAFTFLYCAWLLTRRAVMLILIMVTSSLATAALIIPKYKNYFDQWKTALLANAFFAPLLLLMLWTVIQIMDAMARARMPGLRPESFIEETAIQAAGSAMGRYAMMVVLFVMAIKIADTLAKKGNELFGMDAGSKIGGMFGAMTGGALGLAAKPLRMARLGAAERNLKKYQDEHDGATTFENKEKAREKLEKYRSRLNNSGDFRDSAVMKALQKIGVQTGKPNKEKLIDALNKKKKDDTAKGVRLADFKKASELPQQKLEEKKLVETHDAAKQEHEVKSTELKQAIESLQQTVQEGHAKLADAQTQQAQAQQVHADADKAANDFKKQNGENPNDTAKAAEKRALDKALQEAKGKMDEANNNIEKIRSEINTNEQARIAKQNEQQALKQDMNARERRVKDIKAAEVREQNKKDAASAFKQFVADNKISLGDEGMKAGIERYGKTQRELDQESREARRNSQLGEVVAKNVPAAAAAPTVTPMASPAAAPKADH